MKICCNPFGLHTNSKGRRKSGVKTTLKDVTIEMYESLKKNFNIVVTPGNRICFKCRKVLKEKKKLQETDHSDDIANVCQEEAIGITNASLSLFECSPLKKVRAERTFQEGKRKIEGVKSKFASIISVAFDDLALKQKDDNCSSCDELMKTIGGKKENF